MLIQKQKHQQVQRQFFLVYYDASIDIGTQNFTQRDVINITCERRCVLWEGQIKNMLKNIKKVLLSL